MKLLELYSLATGLRIGQQYLVETFFPLPFDRYVTIQGGSGMASKNYPFYNEVLALVMPFLEAAGIKVVQIGGKDDPPIRGCYHAQGQTNLHQSNYLLRRSLLHIGNDSWLSHRGGELGIPLVICFGPTSIANHGPYRFNQVRSAFIESHRFGRRPTFASQEAQSTMAVIPPEQIANAVLRLIGGQTSGESPNQIYVSPAQVSRQSLYIGEAYNQHLVELVPNVIVAPQLQIPNALIVRMDYVANDATSFAAAESLLLSNLRLRKCLIVTDRELNLNHLVQLKPNVAGLRIEVDKVSPAWIKGVKRLGIQTAFFSSERDPEKLSRLRMDLYDACLFDHYVPPTREDFVKVCGVYLNKPTDAAIITPTVRFSTHKMLLSEGKVHLSKAHWQAGRATPTTEQNSDTIIDSPTFHEEQSHHYFHTE